MFELTSAFNVIVSVAASPSVRLPSAVMLPVACKLPVTVTLPNTSIVPSPLASIVAVPVPSSIPVTVVVVVSFLTSILSPVAGASVNVKVVPDTAYAVVGSCTTPLILTIHEAVV